VSENNTAGIPELLSPAGDFQRLKTAVLYGAGAVYAGYKQFGLRATPQNFGWEELPQAAAYCRERGVKFYLTCNSLPTNREVEELPAFITHAAKSGVDALIVADVGVLGMAKRLAPEMDVHISTQAGVVNYLTATELYHMGASRVVLARELSLDDIRGIRENTPSALELEVFVHGAMCVSFSGRCLLSQYLSARDSNRGQCSQPCRWGYHLMEEKRPGQFFPIYEDDKGTYILNAEDLCLLPHLDELCRAGVSSLKIEGRAKADYYVAVITNAYRMALELYSRDPAGYAPPDWLLEEVCKVSHRRYSSGFLFPEAPPAQNYHKNYLRVWDVVATVDGCEDGCLLCTEKNRFGVGDVLEVLCPGKQPGTLRVTELFTGEGERIDVARHPMMPLRIPCSIPYPPGTMLRRAKEY